MLIEQKNIIIQDLQKQTENLENLSNEELLIIIKEKNKKIDEISLWVNNAWELLKEFSPEHINMETLLEKSDSVNTNFENVNTNDIKNTESDLKTIEPKSPNTEPELKTIEPELPNTEPEKSYKNVTINDEVTYVCPGFAMP